MLRAKRFGEIRAGMPGVATNILTRRLEDLEAGGILIRKQLSQSPPVHAYCLTESGRELRRLVDTLLLWGFRQPGRDPDRFLSPTSLALALDASYRRALYHGETTRVVVDMGEERFLLSIGTRRTYPEPMQREKPPRGVPIFAGAPTKLAAVFFGEARLSDSVALGHVEFHGDLLVGQAIADCFAPG